jgi:anthranilate phosphoribosyltransferase
MPTSSPKTFGANIQRLIRGESLTREETYGMFREVLLDQQPDLQQGAFLAALVAKGETTDEIAGAWRAIDEIDTVHVSGELPGPLCDNSGTGMDRLKTFKVSTAAGIVAAACGVTMARHGARALTSTCGTVDLLEAVGVDVDCEVSDVEQSIREVGIGLFNGMSARVHPGALGRILSQIHFGSTLNIAASLANPGRPSLALRGVYHPDLVDRAASVMQQIGYARAMVVYGQDDASRLGMDELSPCGETIVREFGGGGEGGGERRYTLRPEAVGLDPVPFEEIAACGDVVQEALRFVRVLSGRGPSACEAFTCYNAGAVLYVAGACGSIAEGVERSREAIRSGRALDKLRGWVGVQGGPCGEGTRRLEAVLGAAA